MSANWEKLAFIHVFAGFEAEVFGIVRLRGQWGWLAEGLMTLGFLLYLTCIILVGLMIFAELEGSKTIKIVLIVFLFVGGIVTLLGVALDGGWSAYTDSLLCVGALLGFIAAIFFIVTLVGGGGGGGGSGGGGGEGKGNKVEDSPDNKVEDSPA